jgi:hypothetical protein
MTPSAAAFISCKPSCAWRWRRPPSHSKGSTSMPSTSAPHSFAMRAITGEAPVPVPPPIPAAMNNTSVPSQSARNLAASSSAAARPRSGSPPAPMPRVSFSPSTMRVETAAFASAAASVLMATNSTFSNGARAMWLTALHPAPPTPRTLMRKPPGGRTGASMLVSLMA